ncbi:NodT family efflux transporter outer membrane factor (OMF) lipoprotein [Hephaestia caeni]|uniref:NodT family efflux transporter outer membrane factor (OMF) lipoprotein n=1 Tax=Hephaestia caeni TaxID=645617 RepID=A0A397NH95_9SPHN|nr:efflux transporter outer membrane subunit [Hephaestia caeni]RIA36870.1 NodT family efflux transporter outer membrane factor (OMF) lipoprotein [Hephaestia caeni]
MTRAGASAIVAAALPLAACATPAPRTAPPSIITAQALPAHYAIIASPNAGETAADLTLWWRRFDDPTLTRLIEVALAANQDIVQAAARLVQAQARARAAGAARLPTLGIVLDPARTLTRPAGAIGPRTALDGAASLGWDPDLFGGLASAHRGARAELRAAGYDLATVQRAAVAEVAASYVSYRALEVRLVEARTALSGQRALLDVIEHRYAIGIAVAADVERAKLQLFQIEARVPALDDARRRAANRIAVLIDRPPGTIESMLKAHLEAPRSAPCGTAPLPHADMLPAAGVPADLLRRRPDVRAAEQRIAVAAANAGVARAALQPQLSLGAVIGGAAFSLPSLVDSLVSTVVGRISQTLFDGGRGRAMLDEQRAAARGAIAAYRATILTALEDVENARSAVAAGASGVRIAKEACTAAQRNAALTRGAYEIGLSDLFILLDADQQALAERDALIVAKADQALAQMQLYVALGGGWAIPAPQTLDRPPRIP